jgi:hypothetical protein
MADVRCNANLVSMKTGITQRCSGLELQDGSGAD